MPMDELHSANSPDSAKFVTLPEASRLLGVSIDTLRRRIKDGSLPAVLLAGKYRIRRDHLDGWATGKAA